MALLTDGNPNDSEALRIYEAAILDVAKVESIDLDAKLCLATVEISQDVLDVLLGHTRAQYSLTQFPVGGDRRKIGVSDVVVSQQMKRWHALHTMAVVYRDAYNNQLNDRFKNKWDEYRELARGAGGRAGSTGRNAGAGGDGRDAGCDDLLRAGELGSGVGSRGRRESRNHFSDRRQQCVDGCVRECTSNRGGMECVSRAGDFDVDATKQRPAGDRRDLRTAGVGIGERGESRGWTGGGYVRNRRPDFEPGIALWRRLRALRRAKWWHYSRTRLKDCHRWRRRSL